MPGKASLCALAVTLQTALVLHAEVIPGRWDKVEAQPSGTGIIVSLKSGGRVQGLFRGLEPVELSLDDLAGSAVRIPKVDVEMIQTLRRVPDSLHNGLLIGLGIGLAVGSLAAAQGGAGDLNPAATVVLETVVFGLGGLLIDHHRKSREVLFRAH